MADRPVWLRKREDFLRVQKHGKRFRHGRMVLLVAPGTTDVTRIGFTVSRKVGNAVVRNRVRRRFREIVRHHPTALCQGFDHVIVAYSSAATSSFRSLEEELTWLLERAREWDSGRTSSSG